MEIFILPSHHFSNSLPLENHRVEFRAGVRSIGYTGSRSVSIGTVRWPFDGEYRDYTLVKGRAVVVYAKALIRRERRLAMAPSLKQSSYVDPVCGMTVDPKVAAAQTCYNGVQIFFCAESCKNAFEAEPQKYTLSRSEGYWRRYLDTTGGRPPACH
jgi:YHS domain-containing protein